MVLRRWSFFVYAMIFWLFKIHDNNVAAASKQDRCSFHFSLEGVQETQPLHMEAPLISRNPVADEQSVAEASVQCRTQRNNMTPLKTDLANHRSVNFHRVSSILMYTPLELFACQFSMKTVDRDQR